MLPSVLFNTIKSTLRTDRWDFDSIAKLSTQSWPEICESLELGEKVRKSFSANEGRAITHVVIGDIIANNDKALEDEVEIERDLKMAQGGRR
jgi:hypothetical protein